MKAEKISEFTTQRLSIYLRCLESLEESGVATTSSKMLAERFNLNSAQIRKDLAYFGQFGVRGVGYIVKELRQRVASILGLDRGQKVCIVGGGNLGMALTDYRGFRKNGFNIVAVFDSSPSKVGQRSRSGAPVHDVRYLRDIIHREGVTMAMIAVPAEAAQEVCDRLIEAGIRAILNFAGVRLTGRAGVQIKSIDLSISLESLSYFLSHQSQNAQPDESRSESDLSTIPVGE